MMAIQYEIGILKGLTMKDEIVLEQIRENSQFRRIDNDE